MHLIKKLNSRKSTRWIFFGIASIAVLALTVMNIYSLYALRESTIESAKEIKRTQLEEFADKVQYPLYRPFWGMNKLDMNHVQDYWHEKNQFPEAFTEVLDEALSSSLFSSIHFIPSEEDGCNEPGLPIYQYQVDTKTFAHTYEIPRFVCDGFGISKSRIRSSLEDWRWNSKVTFDSHRTLTLALISLSDRQILGHLNFKIDQDYLKNEHLAKEMVKEFGGENNKEMIVWLRDWVQDEILASSDESYTYNRDQYPIDMRQRFSESFDDWVLHATFLESPTLAASDISLQRNLIVLGFAVFVLFGALMFIFINAKRERDLAERQAGFLANITHELKTPLAVMQAAGENIADGRVKDGERLKTYGNHIFKESVRLKRMIEKLLDAAKVDSTEATAAQSPNKLEELVGEFYEANKEYIKGKGFEFTFIQDENLPIVMVDPDHVETILNNLVENAMKYSSDEKSIHLSVKAQNDSVSLICADKGDGIQKKVIRFIFDKFYRGENSLTAKTKGHGIGLSIVKNMVNLNNGKISVESKPGKGSTFTVTFPAFFKKNNMNTKTSTDKLHKHKGEHVQ